MTAFGVVLPTVSDTGSPLSFGQVAGLAEAAEHAGFASVWVGDRAPGTGAAARPDRPALEAVTLLGALAVRTRRVLLGMMTGAAGRPSPGVLAKLVTTLDVVSGGRAVLGLGGEGLGGVGTGDPPGRVDGDGLEDAVRACRAMFTGDDVTFTGAHLRLEHARNRPPPVQPGGPTLVIGGGEEALDLAARYGDKCVVAGDAPTVSRLVGLLRRHCADLARDPGAIGVVWLAPLTITSSTGETRTVRRAEEARRPGQPDGGALIGRPEEIPGLIAGHLEAGADEVLFRAPSAGAADLSALGRALGLGGGPA